MRIWVPVGDLPANDLQNQIALEEASHRSLQLPLDSIGQSSFSFPAWRCFPYALPISSAALV